MNNLQKLVSIFVFPVLTTFIAWENSVSAQNLEESLFIADSLFEAKKYTESFMIYESIFEIGDKASPAMLLKMSYIKEGLEDYGNALYYLNLYYIQTNNDKVLAKMKDLAANNGISGYEYSEFELLVNYFHKYFNYILILIFVFSVLVFIMIVYQKFKKNKKATTPAIVLVILLALFFYMINFGKDNHQGIINSSHAYIMSGPSSGSDVIDILDQGHKVTIVEQNDVWLKIKWNHQTAYTKAKNVKPILIR